MKRLIFGAVLLSLAAPALVIAGTPSLPRDCTRIGTPHRDIIAGGKRGDVICALGGNDYIHGNGGKDKLRGGPGKDVIVGGQGQDIARAGSGRDRIFLVDGRGGGLADGGKGQDQCYVDPGDKVRSCEQVFLGATSALAKALTSSFHGGLVLAEDLISESPTLPPPVVITAAGTVTITVTKTIPFPACTPPPTEPHNPNC